MSSWVEAINAVIKDDRVRQKKASSKTRLGEAVSGESQSPNRVMDHSLMGKANPSELMGMCGCYGFNITSSNCN